MPKPQYTWLVGYWSFFDKITLGQKKLWPLTAIVGIGFLTFWSIFASSVGIVVAYNLREFCTLLRWIPIDILLLLGIVNVWLIGILVAQWLSHSKLTLLAVVCGGIFLSQIDAMDTYLRSVDRHAPTLFDFVRSLTVLVQCTMICLLFVLPSSKTLWRVLQMNSQERQEFSNDVYNDRERPRQDDQALQYVLTRPWRRTDPSTRRLQDMRKVVADTHGIPPSLVATAV